MIIDVHHHWIPQEYIDNIQKYLHPGQSLEQKGDGSVIKEGPYEMFNPKKLFYLMNNQVRHLDEGGIDMAALSMGCFQDWTTADMAPGINNAMAEVQAKYPRRVIGLAHVDPFHKSAPRELERCVKELGLKGLTFNTNTKGKYPDAREFGPLYKKVTELGIPIVVHAASLPHTNYFRRVTRQGVNTPLLARAIDHMIATTRLVTSGTLREFPGLNFIFGHLGGAGYFTSLGRFAPTPGYKDYDAVKSQMYFDTAPVGWGKLALQAAVAAYGAGNVLMGSDYPAVPHDGPGMKKSVDVIRELDLTPKEKDQILSSTAARLFHLA